MQTRSSRSGFIRVLLFDMTGFIFSIRLINVSHITEEMIIVIRSSEQRSLRVQLIPEAHFIQKVLFLLLLINLFYSFLILQIMIWHLIFIIYLFKFFLESLHISNLVLDGRIINPNSPPKSLLCLHHCLHFPECLSTILEKCCHLLKS